MKKDFFSNKWRFLSILSLSFSISFTIIVFSPLDIYLFNPTAFVVSWRFMLPPLLIACLLLFFFLLVVNIVLSLNKIIPGVVLFFLCAVTAFIAGYVLQIYPTGLIYVSIAFAAAAVFWVLLIKILKENASVVVMLLMWGVLICAYVQILFLNGDMTAITGAVAEYGKFTTGSIINILLWVIITLMPLGIWVIFKVIKRDFKYEKILVLSVLIISGMQLTGLVSTAVTTDLPKGYEEDNLKYTSYEATLSLSSEENILVFILDYLDVSLMQEALERHPHIRANLDGFTHYENNIAEYFHNTLASITSMLTQHYYTEGQTFEEYWEEAWEQHSYIDTLRENGFTTNLYIDYLTTYGSISDLADKTDNLRDIEGIHINIKKFYGTVLRLSLGRLSPYLLKNVFTAHVTPAFGNDFFTITIPDPLAGQPLIISPESDAMFHDYIRQNEISSGNSRRVFTAMHMNGGHGQENDKLGNITGIEKSFAALFEYFDRLKEIGVYDNSTIVVLGDHGVSGVPELTSLLIKPKGSRGELVINGNYELSHKYFAASILEVAGLSNDKPDISYFDIIEGAAPPVRNITDLSSWWTAWLDDEAQATMVIRRVFEVSGDASDAANWIQIR